jgi:hypothetical protein
VVVEEVGEVGVWEPAITLPRREVFVVGRHEAQRLVGLEPVEG